MPATQGPIEKALVILRDALVPFVEQNLERYFNGDWIDKFNKSNTSGQQLQKKPGTNSVDWSPDQVLNTMVIGKWDAFKNSFQKREKRPPPQDHVAKGWIEELLEIRRKAMHQDGVLTQPDIFRFIDTAQLVLRHNPHMRADKVEKLVK
jgi:hypothetical protein